jgi:hypothetical protein
VWGELSAFEYVHFTHTTMVDAAATAQHKMTRSPLAGWRMEREAELAAIATYTQRLLHANGQGLQHLVRPLAFPQPTLVLREHQRESGNGAKMDSDITLDDHLTFMLQAVETRQMITLPTLKASAQNTTHWPGVTVGDALRMRVGELLSLDIGLSFIQLFIATTFGMLALTDASMARGRRRLNTIIDDERLSIPVVPENSLDTSGRKYWTCAVNNTAHMINRLPLVRLHFSWQHVRLMAIATVAERQLQGQWQGADTVLPAIRIHRLAGDKESRQVALETAALEWWQHFKVRQAARRQLGNAGAGTFEPDGYSIRRF